MRKLTLAPFFNIQLFAEGGGAAAGGEGAAAAAPVAAPQQPGVKSNPLADVQYGKQESAPAAGEKGSAEERNSRFEELIKGEFKDLYDARVQNTIRERLKGNEATVQKYNALAPVLDLLAGKYGVEADNIEALSKAIEEDETFYEDEALEKGLTVQQVKEIRKMQRENAALKAQVEERSRKENADATYAAWMQQAEALKQVYPSFDFATEAQNEQFRRLLQSGIPLQTAFEVIHKDEIIPAAMQYTSKFTKADMDEIARRVARGERIVL